MQFFVLNIKIKSSKQSPVDPTVFDVLFKDEKKKKKKKMFKRSETTNGHKYKIHEDYEYKVFTFFHELIKKNIFKSISSI